MTMLGKVFHYTFDAVLFSTVLAGIRRSSGFTPNTASITDPTLRSVADTFLGAGETIFDIAQMRAMNTEYFKKEPKAGSR